MTATANSSNPPPLSAKSRWLPRFGLRTLLILVALFGAGFGYLGHLYRRVAHQRYIVARIQEAGGTVRYDWQLGMGKYLEPLTNTDAVVTKYEEDRKRGLNRMIRVTRIGTVIQDEKLPGPWILRKILGDDVFAYVEKVDFNRSSHPAEPFDPQLLLRLPQLKVVSLVDAQVSDAWLRTIALIPNLRVLDLSGNANSSATSDGIALLESAKNLESIHLGGEWLNDKAFSGVSKLNQVKLLSIGFTPNITSAIFADIAQMTQLDELSIARCNGVEDSGTEQLSRMRNLRILDLVETSIGDATLGRIAALKRLERLFIVRADITDEGVQNLARLSKLKLLALRATNVGDAGAEAICGLPQLRTLDLAFSKVTDACLPAVSRLTQLESLDLSKCDVTDNGLPYLKTLAQLRRLTLGVDVTQQAAEKLHESIPECEIIGFGASGSSNFHLFPARRP